MHYAYVKCHQQIFGIKALLKYTPSLCTHKNIYFLKLTRELIYIYF